MFEFYDPYDSFSPLGWDTNESPWVWQNLARLPFPGRDIFQEKATITATLTGAPHFMTAEMSMNLTRQMECFQYIHGENRTRQSEKQPTDKVWKRRGPFRKPWDHCSVCHIQNKPI